MGILNIMTCSSKPEVGIQPAQARPLLFGQLKLAHNPAGTHFDLSYIAAMKARRRDSSVVSIRVGHSLKPELCSKMNLAGMHVKTKLTAGVHVKICSSYVG